MRMTFSLSDDTAETLNALAARVANGNASLVTEFALRRLFREPFEETQRLVSRQRLERMAATRGGWARAFWMQLFDSVGQRFSDSIREKGPYRFGDIHVTFLPAQAGCEDDENDSFAVYIAPTPVTPESPTPVQMEFERLSSPVSAADAVAAQLAKFRQLLEGM